MEEDYYAFSLEEIPHLGQRTRVYCAIHAWKDITVAKEYFTHIDQADISKEAFAKLGELGSWAGRLEHMSLVRFGCEMHKTNIGLVRSPYLSSNSKGTLERIWTSQTATDARFPGLAKTKEGSQ